MRNKVRKSLAFLLALALVVSVMSGLGLSVSAEQESNTPGTEEVLQQDTTEAGAAPSEVKAEEEAAKPEEKPVQEEKKDEQKKQEETKTDDAAKDDANAQDGDQKDEPQAEPAAEEPAEPEGKPSASYLSTLSVEELYAYLTKLDDNNFAAAWKELTDSQKAEYNAYVLKMTFGDNKATTSYEGGAGAKAMTQAAGLVESAAVSSSSLLRKSPARAAKEAAAQLATESQKPAEGLVMKKTISKDSTDTADTKYTIKLESYATGSETTTVQKTSKPCDIVLVLDQSGSMDGDMKKVTFTDKAFSADAKNIAAYKYNSSLYVRANKVDSDQPVHIAVNLKRNVLKSEEIKTYTPENHSAWQWNDSATNYYYLVDGEYYKVSYYNYSSGGIFGQSSYTLKYVDDNGETKTVNKSGNNLSLTLYKESTAINNVYEYVYTYTDVDGNERKVTIEGNDSTIPTETTHSEFFAGTDGKLYYSEAKQTNSTEKKLTALQNAARSFITSVENDKDGEGNVIDHNIAVVGFSSKYANGYGYFHNTEILTGVQLTDYSYSSGYYTNGAEYYTDYNGCKGDYNSAKGTALQSVRTNNGKKSIANAINALTANGATQTDHGIIMASDIFGAQTKARKAEYENGDRNKIVIVFTDGSPTSSDGFESAVANNAIAKAQELKNGGATVYTIGIFDGADATKEPSTDNNNRENTFMHFVSSNYPNASSMTSSGTKAKDGYYLSATNSSELSQIFQSISQNIHGSTTSVQLDGTTQNIDKMSEDFQFRSGLTEADIKDSIKVYTVPYIGKVDGVDTFNEEKKTDLANAGIEVSGDRVTVTGYSYKDEYIATVQGKDKGTKLVIEIPVEYKNDAWFGGNNIASNDVGSGIYNNNQCYGTYDVPQVNRVIDYKIDAQDQTIYVTNEADLKKLLAYPTKAGTNDNYKPDGIKNRYVNITYTLKDATDNVVGTYTIPAGETAEKGTWQANAEWNPALEDCTEYTWTCKVEPISDGTGALGIDGKENNPAKTQEYGTDGKTKGTVHVLYPTAKAEDKTIYWGEEAKAADLVKQDSWKEKNSHGTIPAVSGTEPTVTVTPDFVAGDKNDYPAKDGAYNVKIEVGTGKNVTETVRSMEGGITTQKESHTNCDDHKDVDDKTYDFRIHVKVKKLTVEKIVGGNMGDTNQGFAFTGETIYDDSKNEVKNKFTLKNGQDVTFKLKVGDDVSITEDSVAGYETSYKVGDDSEVKSNTYNYGKVEAKSPDAVTVIYTNKKQINPPNGITTTIAPYAIMVVLAAGAGVYFVYSRRRRNH